MARKSRTEDDISPDLLILFRGDGVATDITKVGHSRDADVWLGDVHFGHKRERGLYVKCLEI